MVGHKGGWVLCLIFSFLDWGVGAFSFYLEGSRAYGIVSMDPSWKLDLVCFCEVIRLLV